MVERSAERRYALGDPVGFLAYGFGSGLAPVAPGTAGTLAAVPLALLIPLLPPAVFGIGWVLLFAAGVAICDHAQRHLGRADPGGVVWDEMVAFWLVAGLAPPGWPWLLLGLGLFRVFDILKPWPIRTLEQRFSGGLGVMVDDLAAALYTLAILVILSGAGIQSV